VEQQCVNSSRLNCSECAGGPGPTVNLETVISPSSEVIVVRISRGFS